MAKSKSKAKERIYSRLGYDKSEMEKITAELNLVLANYHLLYQKLRNFHWNVKGEDFFDLHEFFEMRYNEVKLAIDDVAERIRIFNHTPYSNYTVYLEKSEIKESPDDLNADDMAKTIIKDFEIMVKVLNNAANVASDEGDLGSEDMIIQFIKDLEKSHWMLSSFKNIGK